MVGRELSTDYGRQPCLRKSLKNVEYKQSKIIGSMFVIPCCAVVFTSIFTARSLHLVLFQLCLEYLTIISTCIVDSQPACFFTSVISIARKLLRGKWGNPSINHTVMY